MASDHTEDWTVLTQILDNDDDFSDQESCSENVQMENDKEKQENVTGTAHKDKDNTNQDSRNDCREQLSDTDSDDDKPLAQLKREGRNRITQSCVTDTKDRESLSECSSMDSFSLNVKDLNSSDSEYDSNMKLVLPKRVRKANWKRKPTNLNKKKRMTPGRPKVGSLKQKRTQREHRALFKAKNESLRQHRARLIFRKYHEKSLDAILASNGFKRETIPGDGNCFFEAVHRALPDSTDTKILRLQVCDHLLDKPELYTGFLNINNDLENYQKQVDYLRTEGHWSVDLADALPLAVANLYNVKIKIFSSNRTMPVIDISPSLEQDCTRTLNLAHLAMHGCDHYESCKPLQSSVQASTCTSPAQNTSGYTTPKKATGTMIFRRLNITPRKQAIYKSPKTKERTRKRKARPENWKKNIRKQLRLSGQEYVSTTGKTVRARCVQKIDCQKCRYKCNIHISDEERQTIFSSFWKLQAYNRQKDFICSNVFETPPGRVRPSAKSPRSCSRSFSLPCGDGSVRVCKSFFLKTLDIDPKMIETAMKNKAAGVFVSHDKRGKHVPHNKTPSEMLENVRRHIESFPLVEAHYTRQDTNRRFLGSDLNVRKMYSLYKEQCNMENKKCVSASKYRSVFCNEYNYSFHIPKKDQCQTCSVMHQKEESGELTQEMEEQFSEHIKRKERARKEKEFDKAYSKQKDSYHAATFDLEAVLPIPCSLVSQVYYKRKLSCYNLSCYSLKNGKASCYLWNETEGKRGSCEIGTCLLMYIRSLQRTVSHVCLFSDSCTGQNRNRFTATALIHAVTTIPNILTIDHKFLESGHTQMECDSIHAAIEHAKKHTCVYVPSQWDTIVQMARKRNPYTVVPLKHTDFLDFKPLTNRILPAIAVDNHGQRVLWMKISWLQFRKSDPNTIYFKYDFDAETFHQIKLKTNRRSGGTVSSPLSNCYEEKLPINEAKKKDLMSLCQQGVIPEEFHVYYSRMPTAKGVRDCLPEPDVLENDME